MKWTTKAGLQRLLARTPAGDLIYYGGQRLLGGLHNFKIDHKLGQGRRLLAALHAAGVELNQCNAVEIGTGWIPFVPLLFWLHGQGECHTFDVTRLLKPRLLVAAVRQLLGHADRSTHEEGKEMPLMLAPRRERLRQMLAEGKPVTELLPLCDIHYHAPCDTARLTLASASVDLLYSNTVLEHVPATQLRALLVEARRVLRPDGHMVHLIDLSDHFAHGDATISGINFLQFSEPAFAKYNTRFCHQNRWRAPRYREAFLAHGFEIVHWEARHDDDALQRLPGLPVHADFAAMKPEDLCVSSVAVVARRK